MKRFLCALIVLSITVSAAVYLNKKAVTAAEEIIECIELYDNAEIKRKWDENNDLFSILLSQDKSEKIQHLISRLTDADYKSYNNLKEEFETIKDSLEINIRNIF